MANIRNLRLIKRNASWWKSDLSVSEKITYYFSGLISLIRSMVLKKQYVKYLGHDLYYDNLVTPLTLQFYPLDIKNIIDNSSGIQIKKVLDIGGNIGQFSLSLSHYLDDQVKIDVFEPNINIVDLLKANTRHSHNIQIFNQGIGDPSIKHLFYAPGKSGEGSIYKQNASLKKSSIKTSISLVNDVAKVTGCNDYDLVKIDVEGYEYRLLKCLKPFRAKLLFLEISGQERFKEYTHSELFSIIEKRFGKFDVLYQSALDSKSIKYDVLFRFVSESAR